MITIVSRTNASYCHPNHNQKRHSCSNSGAVCAYNARRRQVTMDKIKKQVGLSRATLEFQVNVFIQIILDSKVKLLNGSRIQIS